MNPQNENQKAAGRPADSTVNPIRPNLADSSMNQDTQDLDNKPGENENEQDPEKEYIAGEKEGDFPPDIKMNDSRNASLSEGSEFDTDEGTVGQQSIKDQQNRSSKPELHKQ